jgi:hypothetical protein
VSKVSREQFLRNLTRSQIINAIKDDLEGRLQRLRHSRCHFNHLSGSQTVRSDGQPCVGELLHLGEDVALRSAIASSRLIGWPWKKRFDFSMSIICSISCELG